MSSTINITVVDGEPPPPGDPLKTPGKTTENTGQAKPQANAQPTTIDPALSALVDKGLNALKSGDSANYVRLMLNPQKVNFDKLSTACGKTFSADRIQSMQKRYERKSTERLSKKWAECTSVVADWSTAKADLRTGGQKDDDDCGGLLVEYKDVDLTVEVAGRTVRVQFEDPVRYDGTFYFGDVLECK